MPKTTIITVSCGAELECRPVPPYAQAEVRGALPEPPFPKVTVSSAAGGSETLPALPGSAEHEAWAAANRAYRRDLGLAIQHFNLNYGIVAWRLEPEEEWQKRPPDDWQPPAILSEYGVHIKNPADLRANYIVHELILTEGDMTLVESVILPVEGLTKEVLIAALSPFESSEVVDLSNILMSLRPA